MIDLNSIYNELDTDIEAVTAWCTEVYTEQFGRHFIDVYGLFERLQSKTHPITDEELTWILIQLPLSLFTVSETLNRFRVSYEVIKLKNKQREGDLINQSIERTATKRQDEANSAMLEYKLLGLAYSSVITRVENEISFSRELIMGAKKVWDSRRSTDNSNPVSEIDPLAPALPDYKAPQQYIR